MSDGTRSCAGCGETIVPGPRDTNERKWCSEACRVRAYRQRNPNKVARARERAKLKARAVNAAKPKSYCLHCGAERRYRGVEGYCNKVECQKVRRRVHYDNLHLTAPTCSEPDCDRPAFGRGLCSSHYCLAWRKKNPARALAKTHRRRARKRDAFVEDVDIFVLLERDEWVCGLCNEPIPKDAVWPDLEYRTIDHIIPLAKGGEHSYENTQAAHLSCNSAKGDRCEVGAVSLPD